MACIGVIDVETTGLNPYRQDRIVELAAVVIRTDGSVLREFATLVNPERDVGPTSIHGLSAQDVLSAPRFGEIAGAVVEVLDGCVALAGHNVRFDHSFLAVEFARLGHSFPEGPTLCTMQLAGGGSLHSACSEYGVEVTGEAHAAGHDARATAELLATLLKDAPELASAISRQPPISWPDIPRSSVRLFAREVSRAREAEVPTYIQNLLARMEPDLPPDEESSAILAYTALLTRALEDRCVSKEEGHALVELATRWAIPASQIRNANRSYLLNLAAAALADSIVTEAERRDLRQVATLLGLDSRNLDEILNVAAHKLAEGQSQPPVPDSVLGDKELGGKRVCFTGECQCLLEGEPITREMASGIAARFGMTVAESVTKKLDLLVVADPYTQSGKARKARQYGIRVMHEPVFWRALGLEVG
jgi:DNA polymerase III subunit epsilon